MPVSRIASRSARSAVERVEVREHARVQHRQQLGQLAAGRRTWRTPRRCAAAAVPVVLLPHRHEHLVEQRVAEPGHLHVRARLVVHRCRRPGAPRPSAGGRRPTRRSPTPAPSGRSGVAVAVSWPIGTWSAIVWTLKRSALTPAAPAGVGIEVQVLERPQVRRGRRPSRGRRRSRRGAGRRTPCAVARAVYDRRVGERGVVRGGARPDVARRARAGPRRAPQLCVAADLGDRVVCRRFQLSLSSDSIGPVL